MTSIETRALLFDRWLRIASEALDRPTVATVRVLMRVAAAGRDGVDLSALARDTGLCSAAITHTLYRLGQGPTRAGAPGAGLVCWPKNQGNQYTRETVSLTRTGRALLRRMQ